MLVSNLVEDGSHLADLAARENLEDEELVLVAEFLVEV